MCMIVSNMYSFGLGVKKDLSKSNEYYRMYFNYINEMNDQDRPIDYQLYLCKAYLYGLGIEQNVDLV